MTTQQLCFDKFAKKFNITLMLEHLKSANYAYFEIKIYPLIL